MNKFIIVRHGESEQHVRNITGGWSNVSLTDKGFIQAEKTGSTLKKIIEENYKFISSDLLRAEQTAETIQNVIGMEPVYYRELRELNNGDAANLTNDEAKEIFIEPTKSHPQVNWIPYPNGESWRMMKERIHNFLSGNIDSEYNYLIISHGNSIVEIINWYLQIPLIELNVSYDIDPCSITILHINKWNERTINKLNDTGHLL